VTLRAKNRAVWFAVTGGALASATQFVLGIELGLARCEPPAKRFALPIDAWAIGLAAGAAAVVAAAGLAAIAVFRATRGASGRGERIHFLAIVGMTINPLLLVLVIMDGVGVPILSACHQS